MKDDLRAPAATALRHATDLPPAVSGERRDLDTVAGRVTYYVSSAAAPSGLPPLLLIHSINAAGSAYEVKPLYEHYRRSRDIYAIELPGFGHSERSDRKYTPRLMTDAIRALVAEIQRAHGNMPIDALALSLSCEFLARAVTEAPDTFRTLALISPTGFSSRSRDSDWRGGTRGKPWLHAFFSFPLWGRAFFAGLTSPAVIRYFLRKTWGSADIDQGLAEHDYLTTHQPGAEHAPYYFVSGFLFSRDAMALYQSLTLPVWMAHGVRGDFVDYKNKRDVEGRTNWTIDVFQTGAMPHFEIPGSFIERYDSFLANAAAEQ
jgi:pimeloyl-ACP methyl ester carboxylesterase